MSLADRSPNDRPLEFNLTSKGLALTGTTRSASELAAFIEKLESLAHLLPDAALERPTP